MLDYRWSPSVAEENGVLPKSHRIYYGSEQKGGVNIGVNGAIVTAQCLVCKQ